MDRNSKKDDENIRSKVVTISEQEISNQVLEDILDYAKYKYPCRFNEVGDKKIERYDCLIYKAGKEGVGLYTQKDEYIGGKNGTKKQMEEQYGCKIKDPYNKLERQR